MDAVKKNSAQVLKEAGITFGTSGARGLVGAFTDEVCAAFTASFLTTMAENNAFKRVALAIDRRPSSPAMAAACAGLAKNMGYTVDYYGVLPTPALALQSLRDGVPAIMITGSHIPFDRNGIKFYRPDGEISKADEHQITACEAPFLPFTPKLPVVSSTARKSYIARYRQMFPAKMLKGWRIGLYEHSAAGREVSRQILQELGAEVVSLGRSEDFVPIDTEAVSLDDVQRGKRWSGEYALDAIFSTDGDGDRPLVADEKGTWLRGDLLGLICARSLRVDALAVPVSCNTAIEATGNFSAVLRTKIGSPYVIEAMQKLAEKHDRVAGFEANGGFLLDDLPTRDALLPALALFKAAKEKGEPISRLVEQLPKHFTASDRLQNIPTEISTACLEAWKHSPEQAEIDLHLPASPRKIDTTDGLRMLLENGEIVHLRPSGNAPELRCYVEAASMERAEDLLQSVLKEIYITHFSL